MRGATSPSQAATISAVPEVRAHAVRAGVISSRAAIEWIVQTSANRPTTPVIQSAVR